MAVESGPSVRTRKKTERVANHKPNPPRPCRLCGRTIPSPRTTRCYCDVCKVIASKIHKKEYEQRTKQKSAAKAFETGSNLCHYCKFLPVCKYEVWRPEFILPCFVESPRYEMWKSENHL